MSSRFVVCDVCLKHPRNYSIGYVQRPFFVVKKDFARVDDCGQGALLKLINLMLESDHFVTLFLALPQ